MDAVTRVRSPALSSPDTLDAAALVSGILEDDWNWVIAWAL